MGKKRRNKNIDSTASQRRKKGRNNHHDQDKQSIFVPSSGFKRLITGVVFLFFGFALILASFGLAGSIGSILNNIFAFFVGKAAIVIPFVFLFSALIFFKSPYKKFLSPFILAVLLFIIGISGIVGSFANELEPDSVNPGGVIGNFLNSVVVKLFGFWLGQIIFIIISFFGVVIMWHILRGPSIPRVREIENEVSRPTFIKKIFSPKFRTKEISHVSLQENSQEKIVADVQPTKDKPGVDSQLKNLWDYKAPPLDLLEADKGEPSSGDTKTNAAIIKRTLQNFDIPVEMSEVSIGPTVTQYTLKPAEGVKLSKITSLNNDLSLSLASHPIRIEAPIPGRSLVGIEIPNKVRAQVRMRNLISASDFQLNVPGLTLAMGRDVAGRPFFTDLAKMPHMLVAGSTGSGKTIFLNSVLINLLYKNSPATLRLILVDPKRVEFPVYSDIPHLLCPVIYSPALACNALKWLTGEMERRFDLLVEAKSRDIIGYNEVVARQMNSAKSKDSGLEPMPYIVLVIDELADLMAAKGREIEGAIVRIAQMARAVGIHLVLATQRPSVEVITGLIKANITSRVTFQVASQIDSRTILDSSGAEKLLGAGDMLYVSGEIAKPKRIQCAYLQEKEVRRVIEYIKSNAQNQLSGQSKEILEDNSLSENLSKALLEPETENGQGGSVQDDDTLYEEAKRIVIEAKKASASLLQRRLRIGYARAARLIDMLEEKGIVGPAEGARPREIYLSGERREDLFNQEDDGWKKV